MAQQLRAGITLAEEQVQLLAPVQSRLQPPVTLPPKDHTSSSVTHSHVPTYVKHTLIKAK